MKAVNKVRLDKRTKAYKAYLASPEWRTMRIHALLCAEYTCQRCGKAPERGGSMLAQFMAAQSLHVHHTTYARFGHELVEDLEVLCADCHEKEHASRFIRPRGLRAGRR